MTEPSDLCFYALIGILSILLVFLLLKCKKQNMGEKYSKSSSIRDKYAVSYNLPPMLPISATCPNCKNGKCAKGKCHCASGWTGKDCDSKNCPNNCSGNGSCNHSNGICNCQEGQSPDCHLPNCPNGCGPNGSCVSDGVCQCSNGFIPDDKGNCTIPYQQPTVNPTTGKCSCSQPPIVNTGVCCRSFPVEGQPGKEACSASWWTTCDENKPSCPVSKSCT